jgi:hypothetical protein
MRRTVLLAVVVLAGCGGGAPDSAPLGPARAAEPQQITLDWRESYPASGQRLLFAVDRLDIREDGWSVEIEVTNRTTTAFDLGGNPAELGYGVMLFATGDLQELEQAARQGTMPPVRRATSIEPAPPGKLAPGKTWRATLSAPGSLAAGSYLRVAFGPLVADGKPPNEIEPVVFWITDLAHSL